MRIDSVKYGSHPCCNSSGQRGWGSIINHRKWQIAAACLLVAAAGCAQATGFFVNQQSVVGMGRANAGNAAAADEVSTIFFNPAGLAELWREGGEREFGYRSGMSGHIIFPRSDLRNTGSTAASPGSLGFPMPSGGGDLRNPASPALIPNFYLATRIPDSDGYVGIGINTPFGLQSKFRSDWFGRYDAFEVGLQTINIGLVGAVKLSPVLTIGGGLDAQYARSKLVTAIPDPLTPGGPLPSTDGRIETVGKAWSPGFNFGVLYQPNPNIRIGAHYRSGISHDISGTATVGGLSGPLAAANGAVSANAKLKLPAMLGVGVAYDATSRTRLLAQVDWYGWSRLNEIRIQFADGRPDGVRTANFRNAQALSLGGEYQYANDLRLRAGMRWDGNPTIDGFRDTTLPDARRFWMTVGSTYHLSRQASLDIALQRALFRDAQIGVSRGFFEGTPIATATRINGAAASHVTTLSMGFRYSF